MSEINVTSVELYPVNNGSSVKANGSVTLNEMIKLKFALMDGKNGLFISWKGQEKYFDKKEGKDKYSSPIVILREKGEALNKAILDAVLAKHEESK